MRGHYTQDGGVGGATPVPVEDIPNDELDDSYSLSPSPRSSSSDWDRAHHAFIVDGHHAEYNDTDSDNNHTHRTQGNPGSSTASGRNRGVGGGSSGGGNHSTHHGSVKKASASTHLLYQQQLINAQTYEDPTSDERCRRRWRGGVYFPRRYILVIISFLGFVNVYALRAVLSVAIVPMVKEYKWSSSEKGLALSSFFWGYIVTQIPGGWLASRFGGRWVYGLSIFSTGALTLLTPIAAEWSLWAVIAVRALEGLGEGLSYPAMHCIFGKWAPPQERTLMVGVAYAGAHVGTIIAFPVSGVLADSVLGWKSVFYVFGGVALGWLLLWLFFMSNTPDVHPTISDEERKYILCALPPEKKASAVPWADILLCPAFWAILVNHTAANWGFYTLLTELPSFFKNILGFNLKSSGIVSVVPYIGLAITFFISGWVADQLFKRNILSLTIIRKFFQVGGLILGGAALVACGFVEIVPLSVSLMTLSLIGTGMMSAGYGVNHLDIAPNHAGVLMGLTNTAATIPGIVSPILTGLLVSDNDKDPADWRIVFYITAAVYAVGAVVYAIFASGQYKIPKRQLLPLDIN